MPLKHYDLIIIGAGVLGAFHAYHACKKGLRVLLLEKDAQPMEASVRNFGQIVPSGMSHGTWQEYGRRSTEIYKGLQSHFDIGLRANGSVYLASDAEESILLNELHAINSDNHYPSVLLSATDCLNNYPGLKNDYCTQGLFFPEEVTVEPGLMLYSLLAFMQEQLSLHYRPLCLVKNCISGTGKNQVEDSAGNTYSADKVIVCSGRDFKNLFPETFYDSDIEISKLQMMKTVPLKNYRLKGAILTGLSIRRYESFKECPSYRQLQTSAVEDDCRKWGIHILFKQTSDGGIIIGDSHEYAYAKDADILGYDSNQEINDIILKEARRIFDLPNWQIAKYWNGYYSQSKSQNILKKEILPNVWIVTAIGGKGMTASPALAEENISELY